MNPKISIIVAVDSKKGIGKDGGIPWNIPGEQKYFKEITTPHPIIMGRKTFESIGRVLSGRPHFIITRDHDYQIEGATICHSVDQAIEKAKEVEESRLANVILANEVRPEPDSGVDRSPQNDNGEIFVIGGGQIYQEAIDKADRLYLTVIDKDFACDTFFPDYEKFNKIVSKENKQFEDLKYKYLILER